MNDVNGIEKNADVEDVIEIPDGRYRTIRQYALCHHLSRPTVYKMIADGKLTAISVGATTIVLEEKPWGCTEVGGMHQPLYKEDLHKEDLPM